MIQVPSTISCVAAMIPKALPVNPKLCGTFSWPTSKSSFHPFSSRQSLSCCLSQVAKGSTPKPHGPDSHQSQGSPLCQSSMVLSLLHQSRIVLSGMAAVPGFKSQHQSSSAAPFPTPPTISYTCQYYLFFQLYWAATVLQVFTQVL